MGKVISVFVLFVVVALGVFGCSAMTRVPAGNVGVKAYMLGGSKGVDAEVVGPGRYWVGINEEMYLFPTFDQNIVWDNGEDGDERIVFQDVDGARLVAGIGLTYNIDKSKAYKLFQTYRRGIDEITDIFLRTMIKDALVNEAATMKVDAIYGTGKEKLLRKVEARVRKQVEGVGINVKRISWVGEMELPPTVLAALNSKITATQNAQKVENQLRTATASAAIKVANAKGVAEAKMIAAKAEADANRLITASISAELVNYMQAQKWNGQLPKVTGNATPIVDMR